MASTAASNSRHRLKTPSNICFRVDRVASACGRSATFKSEIGLIVDGHRTTRSRHCISQLNVTDPCFTLSATFTHV